MIIIGCDHGGYEMKNFLKEYLLSKGEEVIDVGAKNFDAEDDFSTYAKLVAENVLKNGCRGIAVCGSGVGMCIALNRFKGIYAVNGFDAEKVALARQHNNVNVLALGGRMISFDEAKDMVDAFLKTDFLAGKYQRRIDDIDTFGWN